MTRRAKLGIAMDRSLSFIYSYGMILLVYLSAALLQYNLFLGFDLSSLLITTNQLLDGKNYVTDFFIPNPPLTLYLYALPVYVNKITGISIHFLTILYIFIWATFSLAFCARLMGGWREDASRFIMLPLLAFIFLIFPQVEIGQRDCMLLIFTMPYLLSMVNRLNGIKPSNLSALTVGILLAMSVGIKPQYIFVPLLVEGYYLFVRKKWTANFRLDTLSAVFLFLFYIGIIYIFHFKFLSVILPYMMKNYYLALRQPLLVLLSTFQTLFCFIPIIIFILVPHKKNLEKVLLMALLGFFLLYFSQRTLFPHHAIPFFSLAILLSIILTYRLLDVSINNIIFYEIAFLIFLVLADALNNWIGLFDSKVWGKDILILCMIELIFGALFFLSTKYFSSNLYYRTANTLFAMIIMFIPIIIGCTTYAVNLVYKDLYIEKLLALSHTIQGRQKVCSLSHGTYYAPFILQANYQPIQRYDCLWMVQLLIKDVFLHGEKSVRLQLQNNIDPDYYINQISHDLNEFKPDLVLLNKVICDHCNIEKRFDYLDYFLENPAFKNAWAHYHYSATIDSDHFLKHEIIIFKRNVDISSVQ